MDDGRALTALPPRFEAWFASRGWSPRAHQVAMVEKARAGRHALLIAPTGGGKTLAGFLPSLIELSERPPSNTPRGVHTLYLSPLKALAVDVERNLMAPIAEMGLVIKAESRTGDTGISRRQRLRDHRRGARHLAIQARRPAVAGPGAAAAVRAEPAPRRSFRHRRRPRRDPALADHNDGAQ